MKLTSKKKILQGGGLLTLGGITVAICSFLRNIVIARALSVENFGIATILAMVMTFAEMTGNLAFDRFIIQAEDGESDEFVGTLHTLQIIKGLFLSAMLFVLAGTIARAFSVPDALLALQIVSLIPLIRGLSHLDRFRLQRRLDYSSTVLVQVLPSLIGLLSAFVLAQFISDFSVMIWVLLANALTFSVASHICARSPYTLSLNKEKAVESLRFGWPVLVNGFLMFLIVQGDKSIVGAFYGPAILGAFSVAFMMVMVPANLMTRLFSSLLLPILSSLRSSPDQFIRWFSASAWLAALTFLVFSLVCAGYGVLAVEIVFGEAYMPRQEIMVALALMWGIRLLRVVPTNAAISMADTKTALYGNLCRLGAFPLAAGFAAFSTPIEYIVYVGATAELLANGITAVRLKQNHGIPYSKVCAPIAAFVLVWFAVYVSGVL